ncbi:MAG: DUF4129 domain-containing protein [Nitrososphaerota archaeon]|nr:DUF4129 domain-containing protein [Nitrososphaerota archaeon]MDG6924092.1 DUF4129 domain-containing protein [Nitrososphaerota archaeon]
MRCLAGQVLLAACLLTLLFAAIPTVHAFDSSIDTNTGQSSTINPQQLQTLLSQLQQSNDTQTQQLASNPQFQQLMSQFNSSLTSGNSNLTASSLSNLQNFLSSTNSTSLLSSVLKSLQPSGSGVTINPSTLSSLLNLGPNGLPNGITSGNAASEISGLTSLANLVKNINPQLAGQLLNAATGLSMNFGIPSKSLGLNSFGSLNSLKGLQSPSLATPKLGSSSSPKVQLELLVVPIILVAACLALFFLRGTLAGLLRGQRVPGVEEEKIVLGEYDPNDPKKRILYYFAKTVQFMRGKGIAKTVSDTHREFSAKCAKAAGSEHVSTISNFYEKAQFSGRSVTNDDANHVERELSSLENPFEVKSG